MSVRGIAGTVCLRHPGTNKGADSEKCADEFEGRHTRGACSAGQLQGERRQATWVENEVAGPELNSSEGRNEPEGKRSKFHAFAPDFQCSNRAKHRLHQCAISNIWLEHRLQRV
jgi:hypothetical protein